MDVISAVEALDRNTRQVAAFAAALLEGDTLESLQDWVDNDLRSKLKPIAATSDRLFSGVTRQTVLLLSGTLVSLSERAAKTEAIPADKVLSHETVAALNALNRLHEGIAKSISEN